LPHVALAGSDLEVVKTVDNATPAETDTVTCTITLTNNGPDEATGVQVEDVLLAGLTYLSDTPSQGTYTLFSGIWDVGTLANGNAATLIIQATVDAGTGGATIPNTASIYASDQTDPVAVNNSSTVAIVVGIPDFRVVSGRYTGDGLPTQSIATVGFQPDLVIIKGDNAERAVARTSTMIGDASIELSGNGGLQTDLVVSLDASGFTVGGSALVNEPGVTFYWTAFKAAAGQMVVDTYVGNGTAGTSISELGFQPDYVLIMSEFNRWPMHRFQNQVGDATLYVVDGSEYTNRIVAFEPDGFRLGSNADINRSGTTHHFVALNERPGLVDVQSYVGDNSTSRDFLGVGFQPEYLLLESSSTMDGTVHRTGTVVGDTTLAMDSFAPFSNGIKAFLGGGFQLGNDSQVNSFGVTYHYLATRGISGVVDLEVTKIVDVTLPNEGDPVTYTVTVTNNGPDDATGIEVTDLLPSGLTYSSDTPSQGLYVSSTGVWTVGSLSNMASATLTLVATVDAGTAGSVITNTASATAVDQPEVSTSNDEASAPILVQSLSSGYRMATGRYVGNGAASQSVAGLGFQPDAVFVRSDQVSATVVRSSSMPDSVSKALGPTIAVLKDRIISLDADGFTVGPNVDVNAAAATYYWTAFKAFPGQLVCSSYKGNGLNDTRIPLGFEPTYVVVMSEDGYEAIQRFSRQAFDKSMAFKDSDQKAGLIKDFEPTGFLIGKQAGINKAGNNHHFLAWKAAPGVVSDSLYTGDGSSPRSMSTPRFKPKYVLASRGDTGAPTVHRPDSLLGDNTLYVDDTGVPFTGGITSFDSQGFTLGVSPNVNAVGAEYFYVAFGEKVDLSVVKNVDDSTPSEGATVTYTIQVTNNGPGTATGIEVTDLLPAGVTYSSHLASQGSYVSGTGVWTVGTLANSAFANLTLVATVDAGTGGSTITNTATVSASDQQEAVPADNSDSADITVSLPGSSSDLEVTKTVDDAAPNEGDTVTYTVTVTNTGPDDGTGIEVTDLLPVGVTYVSDTPTQGSYVSGTGVWTVGAVANADSATLTLVTTVDAGTGGTTINNTAIVTALDQTDSDATNDSTTVGITVQSADLAVSKTVDNPNPNQGATVTYTVIVTNAGPNVATNVVVTDALPAAGVTYVSDTPTQGSYASGTGVWTVGSIANAASDTLTLVATVDSGPSTLIMNTATVTSADQSDPVSSNNSDSATVFVVAGSNYSMATGKYSGDGGPSQAISGLGFQPNFVIVKGENAATAVGKTSTMPGALSKSLGPNDQLQLDHIVSLDADGFTVGSNLTVNTLGTTYHWTAFAAGAGLMAVSSYTGNNANARTIPVG
jgi:uncharacterized repeat protein (TIGR01451 family)